MRVIALSLFYAGVAVAALITGLILVGDKPGAPAAVASDYSPEQTAAFARLIRAADFRCAGVSNVSKPRAVPEGTRFKVYCDNWAFAYELIVTPSKQAIVRVL
jgi:hypothetical protein